MSAALTKYRKVIGFPHEIIELSHLSLCRNISNDNHDVETIFLGKHENVKLNAPVDDITQFTANVSLSKNRKKPRYDISINFMNINNATIRKSRLFFD